MSDVDVAEKRSSLFNDATKVVQVNRGDRRVGSPRICVVCSRPLSTLVIQKHTYISTYPHKRFHFGNLMVLDACEKARSCHRYLNRREK